MHEMETLKFKILVCLLMLNSLKILQNNDTL